MKTGLTNLANTCYLNSALQCLMHVPELQNYFLSTDSNNISKYDSQNIYFKKRSNVLSQLSEQFRKLMLALMDKDNRPVRPITFRNVLSIFKPIYRTAQQQDSHECLILILDKLHESLVMQVSIDITGLPRSDLEKRKQTAFIQYKKYLEFYGYSEISNIFYGQFENTVTCGNCGNVSFNYDPYTSLEIEIPANSHTIYDCLDNYCFEELLNQSNAYKCSQCKELVEAKKELKIWTVPKILIIQLKRFKKSSPNTSNKNNRHIEVPLTLNMTKYITHPVAKESGLLQNVGLQMFDLLSIIEHSGTLDGGHYTAKCKVGNSWCLFNDASVSNIPESEVCTTNAYVLIYRMNEHTQKLWEK